MSVPRLISSSPLNAAFSQLEYILPIRAWMRMAPSATSITQQYASIDINENPLRVNSTIHDNGKEYGKSLTRDVLKGRVEAIDTDTCAAGDEDAFFVADMGEVYRQHIRWKKNLKRVKPHYGAFSSIGCPRVQQYADIQ